MIVFKTFLKVLNKCKIPIIIYTIFLIIFGGFNIKNSENDLSFTTSKPDIYIINNDENKGLTKNLINFLESNSNIISLINDENKINDAIFYRDVNFVIYIPKDFAKDFLNNQNPEIKVKSTKDYLASLAQMNLEKYLNTAKSYMKITNDENELISYLDETLKTEVKTEVTSKLDTNSLEKASFYYNFTNYCLLAGSIYVICMILASFKNELIEKRTIISSMNYKKYTLILLLCNSLFIIVLWLFYIFLSFILVGDIMFSTHGLIYMLNSFIFSLCSLSIAFLLGSTIKNKEAINGIVNVIALGSSFLCGAFVPSEFLPTQVLKIAHILPSYWFINTNELIKDLEIINLTSLKPIIFNSVMIIIFSLLFVIITLLIVSKKRKIN